MNPQSVHLGSRIIDLYKFTGEVMDEKTWATTHVSGGGGGYNVGSGQNNPVTISSVSVTHDQFFLKSEDGKEMAVEMANSGVAVRKGHRITVFWGVVQGQTNRWYVAAYNHSTNTPTILDSSIQALAMPPTTTAIMLAWVVSFFAICLYGLGIIALVVLTVVRRKQKRELLTTLRTAVDRMVAECADT